MSSMTWSWPCASSEVASSYKMMWRLLMHLLKKLLLMDLIMASVASILRSSCHVLIAWQLLCCPNNVSFTCLHLIWKSNYCSSSSRVILSIWEWLILIAVLGLVYLNTTQFARNFIHGKSVMLESSTTLWTMSNIWILIGHSTLIH